MSLIINYTEAQYKAKIIELEGYFQQLERHLTRMEELKQGMGSFWNDENARKAGENLYSQIRQVINSMDRTQDMINFYKSSVESLTNVGTAAMADLEEALGLTSSLGI